MTQDDEILLTTVEGVPVYASDLDVTPNDALRELVEELRDEIEPVGGMEQRNQTLSDCADRLEELIDP